MITYFTHKGENTVEGYHKVPWHILHCDFGPALKEIIDNKLIYTVYSLNGSEISYELWKFMVNNNLTMLKKDFTLDNTLLYKWIIE